MTTPTPTLEQLAAAVAAMQADISRLQADVASLKTVEQGRQRDYEWAQSIRRPDPDPKPREAGRA